jgi:serine/threonine-protein kinase
MTGTPEPEPAARVDDAPAEAEVDPEIGQVIDGRYKILATIGAGGMGAVYRAEHVGMGKQVAVKLLHAHVSARRDAGSRFRREAYAGGRIDHPNCVQVSDFGERDDGSFYLVMELLTGESLRDVMDREGRLAWPRALGIARHVLRGLAYAHQQDVVHRDIKPDNVFLCRHPDDPEFAKILDFGIAKLIGSAAAEQSTVTQAGMTVGTPTYLSPEQAFGGKIGPATDLYSLSVVLFEMLAGRPPFVDDEPVKLLTAHATKPVPRFEEIAPDAQLPPAVEELVRRGLAKVQDERFTSADEYVMEIDRVRAELVPGLVRATTLPPFAAPHTGDTSAPMARLATPFPQHTPYPLAVAGSAPTAAVLGAIPPPRKKLPIGWIVAAILTVGVIAAIVAGSPGRGSSNRPNGSAAPAPAASGSAKPSHASAPQSPAPAPTPAASGSSEASASDASGTDADADAKLAAAIHDLENGTSCAARKKAVAALRDLGDARAIPALKKARYRMRGTILGYGGRNVNACLTADATAAITALGGS